MSTHRRALLAATAASLLATLGIAAGQVTAQPPAPQPPATAEPEPATPASPPATEPAASSPGTPPPARSVPRGTAERFEPTEKVRPDFDVAFPVDI